MNPRVDKGAKAETNIGRLHPHPRAPGFEPLLLAPGGAGMATNTKELTSACCRGQAAQAVVTAAVAVCSQ